MLGASVPWLTIPVVLSAALTGLAVLFVTWFSERIGGSKGGLLATAPVTTTGAFLHLASSDGLHAIEPRVLAGGASLFAAIAAMPAYFWVAKWTRGWVLWSRIVMALAAYISLFTLQTVLYNEAPASVQRLWFPATFLLVLGLYFTFMRVKIDPVHLRGAKPPLRWPEAIVRFLSGAAVILLVSGIASVSPRLAAAWAVFPGVFLVTVAVLGLSRGAAFSARATQAASLGGVPLGLYLLTFWFLLPVANSMLWAAAAMVAAWGAYFGALVPLYRVRKMDLHY